MMKVVAVKKRMDVENPTKLTKMLLQIFFKVIVLYHCTWNNDLFFLFIRKFDFILT